MTNRTLMTWFALGHLANDWPIATLWLIVPAAGFAMSLSPAEIGLLFTIFGVGGALTYVPAGFLADHVSNRGRLLVLTFWWVAVGYALAALAPGFWSLAALLALAGMGNAAWHPIAAGVLTRHNKTGRARALGVHAIGGSIAEVLAPLSVGLLLSFVTWRGALAISVLPTIFMGICFLWVARSVPHVEKKPINWQGLTDMMDAWRAGKGLRVIATISLYNLSLIALLSMIPLYLTTVHYLTPVAVGIVFAGLLITGALAQPGVGSLSDKLSRGPVLVIGSGIAAFAIATLIFEPPFWIMIAMMALGIAALDAIRAVMLATAVDHTDRSEGTTLGFAFLLMDGVGALGAVLAGAAAGISWSLMFGLAATFALGAALLGAGVDSRSMDCGRAPRSASRAPWKRYIRSRKDARGSACYTTPTESKEMTVEEVKTEHTKRYGLF